MRNACRVVCSPPDVLVIFVIAVLLNIFKNSFRFLDKYIYELLLGYAAKFAKFPLSYTFTKSDSNNTGHIFNQNKSNKIMWQGIISRGQKVMLSTFETVAFNTQI